MKRKQVGTYQEIFVVSCCNCENSKVIQLEEIEKISRNSKFCCKKCSSGDYDILIGKKFTCPCCKKENVCITEPEIKDKDNVKYYSFSSEGIIICSDCLEEFKPKLIIGENIEDFQSWKRLLFK